MITRIWHGKTSIENCDVYLNYIQETGLKDYRNTSGNLSAKILRKAEGDICHFWTITEWDNLESIKNLLERIMKKRGITRWIISIYWNLKKR